MLPPSGASEAAVDHEGVERLLERRQEPVLRRRGRPGTSGSDAALREILHRHVDRLDAAGVSGPSSGRLLRTSCARFLRVSTTLAALLSARGDRRAVCRSEAVERLLSHADGSAVRGGEKFDGFVDFVDRACSTEERRLYIEAASELRQEASALRRPTPMRRER